MGTTSNRSYPYPAGSDAVDVPGDIQALADAVDSDVAAIEANDWVTTARIDDGSVTAAKLATDAVETAKIDDGAVTDAKLAVPKVDQAVVGNLLTANVATGTDTLGDTTGFAVIAGGIASSTDYAWQGSRSIKLALNGIAGRVSVGGSTSNGTIPVSPGQVYTFQTHVYAPTVTEQVSARIYWWTSAGNVAASTAYNQGSAVTTAASWQPVSVSAVAPANAAFASALVASTPGSWAASDVRYEDGYTFHQGAGGLWAPPGTPIANLGTYTDESVGRRIFTWDAVNSRWQMTYGDTGWRDVAPENGWTANVLRVRRVGNSCHLAVFGLSGAAATAETFYTLPVAFAPQFMVRAAMSVSAADTFYTMQVASGLIDVDTAVTAGRMQHSWLTEASWPTSLPGTAAYSIPS